MARPIKEGMDYFPHDTDAANDEKIEILRSLHGNDGYVFYFILLERIYRMANFELIVSDAETLQILARKVAVTPQKLSEMIQTAIKYAIFDPKRYQEEGILTSNGIKKRSQMVVEKREDMRKKYHQGVSGVVSDAEMGVESTQSKGKESKGKESKDIVADATEKEFDFVSYRTAMLNNANLAIKIIAGYWMTKGFTFTNARQVSAAIARELRPANALTGYELKKIGDTMRWLKQNADFKWTLESVGKYILEDLENIEKLKDKNYYKCRKGLWHKTGQPCGH